MNPVAPLLVPIIIAIAQRVLMLVLILGTALLSGLASQWLVGVYWVGVIIGASLGMIVYRIFGKQLEDVQRGYYQRWRAACVARNRARR